MLRKARTDRRPPRDPNSSRSCCSQSNTRTTSRSGAVSARQRIRHKIWPTRCSPRWMRAQLAHPLSQTNKYKNKLTRVVQTTRMMKSPPLPRLLLLMLPRLLLKLLPRLLLMLFPRMMLMLFLRLLLMTFPRLLLLILLLNRHQAMRKTHRLCRILARRLSNSES